MGKLDGKVAVVTGAARGQGRSHAVTLAKAGADIIALDICADIENVQYPLATPADLEETQRLVEKEDRRCVDRTRPTCASPRRCARPSTAGWPSSGGLDIVVANAGIAPLGPGLPGSAFLDTRERQLPRRGQRGHARPTRTCGRAPRSSPPARSPRCSGGVTDITQQGPGGAGYSLSKREVARFVHDLALALAPESIRVNAVHPGNVNTDMLHNPPMYKVFRPDLEDATREDFEPASAAMFPMPISWLEPQDISEAVLFLASDDARYITGQQLRVDGGVALKHTRGASPTRERSRGTRRLEGVAGAPDIKGREKKGRYERSVCTVLPRRVLVHDIDAAAGDFSGPDGGRSYLDRVASLRKSQLTSLSGVSRSHPWRPSGGTATPPVYFSANSRSGSARAGSGRPCAGRHRRPRPRPTARPRAARCTPRRNRR